MAAGRSAGWRRDSIPAPFRRRNRKLIFVSFAYVNTENWPAKVTIDALPAFMDHEVSQPPIRSNA
ncbi:MAG: hypothetical protein WBN07_10195 [Woeseiaceae bacterium]